VTQLLPEVETNKTYGISAYHKGRHFTVAAAAFGAVP
jgi:hypothetical protein